MSSLIATTGALWLEPPLFPLQHVLYKHGRQLAARRCMRHAVEPSVHDAHATMSRECQRGE